MATEAQQPDVDGALARLETLLAGSTGPHVPDRLDPACIRWVCLVPVWTPTLASRCGMPGWASAADPRRPRRLARRGPDRGDGDAAGDRRRRAGDAGPAPLLGAAQRAAVMALADHRRGRSRQAGRARPRHLAPRARAATRSAHAHRHLALGRRRRAGHEPGRVAAQRVRAGTRRGARPRAARRSLDVDRGPAARGRGRARRGDDACTSVRCVGSRCSIVSAATGRCCTTICRGPRCSRRTGRC